MNKSFATWFAGLAIVAVANGAVAVPSVDEQLVGRWCSKDVIVRLANGKTTSSKSNASQYTVQTFSKDRVAVEWVRPPQAARWIQSYVVAGAGQLWMKMLEHSSLPSLVGSKSAYRYQIQGNALKLITQPQEKQDPIVESTWTRCEESRPIGTPNPVPYQ